MAEEVPQSLDLQVLQMIRGALKSREVWNAERPDGVPPYSDDQAMLQNWASVVSRQGSILANLSVVPSTRAELMASMPGMVNRAPAWLDAHLQGRQEMTLELFMQGIAQTLARHRDAMERVVSEQVANPESIEETLAEAPIPTGAKGEDRSDLISGVGCAMSAHMKALVDIAYDLEIQVGRLMDPDN